MIKLVRLTFEDDGGDSTTVPVEASGFSTSNLETWYIGNQSTADSDPFYRLSSGTDSMDSPVTAETGHSLDRLLGYAWLQNPGEPAPRQGITPISRYVSGLDHRTWLTSQGPSGGYSVDQVFDAAHPNTQLVLDAIGDMVQSLVRFAADTPNCRNPNSTQSGGAHCSISGSNNLMFTERWAGSPVISTVEVVDSVDPLKTGELSTLLRPLEFCHNGQSLPDPLPWPNADPYLPLAWKGHLKRTDTVGCRMTGTGFVWPDIIKTSTQAELAYDGRISDVLNVENVHWLKAEPFGDYQAGDFSVELVNLATQQVLAIDPYCDGGDFVFDQPCVLTGLDNSFPYAVLFSRSDGDFSIALARLDLTSQSVTSVWVRCGLNCTPQRVGLIIAMFDRKTVERNDLSDEMTSYLISNSRSIVLSRLATLANDGGDCPMLPVVGSTIFVDGFESGGTGLWTTTVQSPTHGTMCVLDNRRPGQRSKAQNARSWSGP